MSSALAATPKPSSPADQSKNEQQHDGAADRHRETPPVPSGHACVSEQASLPVEDQPLERTEELL